MQSARPVLPFAKDGPRQSQPSSPDGALPFRSTAAASEVFRAPETVDLPPAPVVTPPPPVRVPPPPPAVVPAPVIAPAPVPAPAPVLAPESRSSTSAGGGPRLGVASFDAAFGGPKAAPESRSGTSFDAAFGGVRAASDAAAARTPKAEAPREGPARFPSPSPSPASSDRQAVVSLLCFDANVVPRLRRAKRFASALDPKARPKRAQGVDEPQKALAPDERGEVLRVLSFGQPADPAEIHRALTDCLEDLDDLDPPLLLVAGELRPTFDEVEVLRVTAQVAQQVAGGDKKVLGAIAVGQEALAAPIAPRPETTLGFVRQIELAAGGLSLPPRYVPAEVERVLVEGRKYKRRTVLGAPRLRADLVLTKGGEAMPLYLPDTAATSLPLLLAFPVVALCEIIPREDLAEAQDEALLASALARVLRSR
jgi:hypothetical protein